jgi:hypothetical protein
MKVAATTAFTKADEGEAKALVRAVARVCHEHDGSMELLLAGEAEAPALLGHLTVEGKEYGLTLAPLNLA